MSGEGEGWIIIFPTSRLPPWWAICRWGILISRYINIAHLGYSTIFISFISLSCIQNGPNLNFNLVWVRGFWRRRFVNSMAITLPPISVPQEWDVVYVSNKYISTDITLIQPAFSKRSFSRSQQDVDARCHEEIKDGRQLWSRSGHLVERK